MAQISGRYGFDFDDEENKRLLGAFLVRSCEMERQFRVFVSGRNDSYERDLDLVLAHSNDLIDAWRLGQGVRVEVLFEELALVLGDFGT